MGFMERTRSIRKKEGPAMRNKQEESTATQPMTIEEAVLDKDLRRNIKSAHSHVDAQWPLPEESEDANVRPRTAGRAPARISTAIQSTPTIEVPRTVILPPRSSRMSIASPVRTTSQPLISHTNHSTTSLLTSTERPKPGRSFTTPINTTLQSTTKDEKPVEAPTPTETTSPAKEPQLRKSKSGTWRSFFRRLSKPPQPDFNPAELEAAPAVPKLNTKKEASKKSNVLEKKQKAQETSPSKDALSIEKTRDAQKQRKSRAQVTKSVGSASALSDMHHVNFSQLRLGNASAAELGMLDVKIPGVEMERYSIMFEQLLEPQTSIAERRQTAVKQLQLRNDSPEPVQLQRYATSPSLAVKPSESDPQENTQQTPAPAAVQHNRLLRSQTAPPGGLISATANEKAMSTANNSSVCSANSPVWSEISQPATPTSDTNSILSFDINDDDEEVEIVTCNAVSLKYTPSKDNPRISSAPAIPMKAAGRNSPPAFLPTINIDRSHPPRTSSLEDASLAAAQHKLQQQQQTPEPQIGVARRVSVMHRASAMGTLTVPGAPTSGLQRSGSVVDSSSPVPVFSRQPLRPKLVDVRNRKSTLVVLDEA